jgi:predicted DNA-binding transcriptional regulator AlpA
MERTNRTSCPITEDEELLTGPEVDKWLRISAVTRWRWTRNGLLPPPRKLHPGGPNIYFKKQIKRIVDSALVADAYRSAEGSDK